MTSMLIFYLLAMLTELYMYCWFGNEIMHKVCDSSFAKYFNISLHWSTFFQSYNIGDACYLSEWYDCSESAKKNLLTIMQRTRKPLKITTFGFATLSLTTFTSVSISSKKHLLPNSSSISGTSSSSFLHIWYDLITYPILSRYLFKLTHQFSFFLHKLPEIRNLRSTDVQKQLLEGAPQKGMAWEVLIVIVKFKS